MLLTWRPEQVADLRITRVFQCVARGLKDRASFMFVGCCWRRSLAADGGSGASRGARARNAKARSSMVPTPSQPPSAIGTNLCSRLRMASLRSSELAQSTCSYLVSAPPRWPRSFRVSSGSSSSGAAPYRGRPASGDRPVPDSLSNHAMIPGCRPIGGQCARGQHAGHAQARTPGRR